LKTINITELKDGWRFTELNPRGNSEASDLPWMPAEVPGHVHLDLMRNGVIEDPFNRMAERACAWVDETDWVYETSFQLEEAPAHAYLRFKGLDTIAEITLNGEELARTDNMFVPHEFPVGGKLRAGENTLRIVFRSALRIGRERQKVWADAGNETMAPHWFVWGPRSFVRKAQYMYGWDWGPELVSCGIWQSVELITVPVARLLDWKHSVEFTEDNKAILTIDAEVERAPGKEEAPVTLTLGMPHCEVPVSFGIGGSSYNRLPSGCESITVDVPSGSGTRTVQFTVTIDNPERWNPLQLGKPSRYYMFLSLDSEGIRLEEIKEARIGLRTIELIREADPDGQGEGFKFRVNGNDIFSKGANWIPDDSFVSRGGIKGVRRRTQSLVTAARIAHMNMLRVWGGGLYESETFYDQCDKLGILVWQDFPYGCAYYPDTGEYAEAARNEAAAAIKRIRKHACLALWCGNNENDMMANSHWERPGSEAPRYLGEKLYHEILPAVLAAEDPATPYWPSSPYGGDDPNSQTHGDRHDWDVWHGVGDWTHYPEDDSRFVSEFGFASSCGLNAWESCLAESDKSPRSPVVRWHDKTRKGYETYLGYSALHFPEPQTLEDLVYYTQLNQAEALKCGVEHWRRRKGRCWGTLYWQLNDCWPVQSWAVIDSKLEPKAAYYATKRFYAPVLLSLVREGDEVHAHLTNDLLEHIQGDVTLCVETFDGDLLLTETFEAHIEANGTEQVGSLNLAAVKVHERDVYVYAKFEPYWDLGGSPVENYLFLAEPKDLRLANPGLKVDINLTGWRTIEMTLTAARFAPYVWWRFNGMPADPGAFNADNFFHLRAGQSRTVRQHKFGASEDFKTVEDARACLVVRHF
jgi:beta-mannosidase